jgi:hypothetical protein
MIGGTGIFRRGGDLSVAVAVMEVGAAFVDLARDDMDVPTAPGHTVGVAALGNARLTTHVLAVIDVNVSAVHREKFGVLHVSMLGLVEPWVTIRLRAQIPARRKYYHEPYANSQ